MTIKTDSLEWRALANESYQLGGKIYLGTATVNEIARHNEIARLCLGEEQKPRTREEIADEIMDLKQEYEDERQACIDGEGDGETIREARDYMKDIEIEIAACQRELKAL